MAKMLSTMCSIKSEWSVSKSSPVLPGDAWGWYACGRPTLMLWRMFQQVLTHAYALASTRLQQLQNETERGIRCQQIWWISCEQNFRHNPVRVGFIQVKKEKKKKEGVYIVQHPSSQHLDLITTGSPQKVYELFQRKYVCWARCRKPYFSGFVCFWVYRRTKLQYHSAQNVHFWVHWAAQNMHRFEKDDANTCTMKLTIINMNINKAGSNFSWSDSFLTGFWQPCHHLKPTGTELELAIVCRSDAASVETCIHLEHFSSYSSIYSPVCLSWQRQPKLSDSYANFMIDVNKENQMNADWSGARCRWVAREENTSQEVQIRRENSSGMWN